jgi:hypothetical protein
MNILHSKNRNRLTPTRIDRLLYVQVNRRTLRREPHCGTSDSDEQEDTLICGLHDEEEGEEVYLGLSEDVI